MYDITSSELSRFNQHGYTLFPYCNIISVPVYTVRFLSEISAFLLPFGHLLTQQELSFFLKPKVSEPSLRVDFLAGTPHRGVKSSAGVKQLYIWTVALRGWCKWTLANFKGDSI